MCVKTSNSEEIDLLVPIIREEQGVNILIKRHTVANHGALQPLSQRSASCFVLFRTTHDGARSSLHISYIEHLSIPLIVISLSFFISHSLILHLSLSSPTLFFISHSMTKSTKSMNAGQHALHPNEHMAS